MKPIAVLCCALTLTLGAAGCAWHTPFDRKPKGPNPNAPKVTHAPVVTTTGRKAAVLSVHLRKEFPDACMFGLTLTNNLDDKITNLSVRVAAYLRGGVRFDSVTRNFYEVRPTESQYRDLVFTAIRCQDIEYLSVSDPGRCAIGDANRFTTAEGDCVKFLDVAESRLVSVRIDRTKRAPPVEETPVPTTGAAP